jgi:hypothetical protein
MANFMIRIIYNLRMIKEFNDFTLQYLKFECFKFAQNPTALDPGFELYIIFVLQFTGQSSLFPFHFMYLEIQAQCQ